MCAVNLLALANCSFRAVGFLACFCSFFMSMLASCQTCCARLRCVEVQISFPVFAQWPGLLSSEAAGARRSHSAAAAAAALLLLSLPLLMLLEHGGELQQVMRTTRILLLRCLAIECHSLQRVSASVPMLNNVALTTLVGANNLGRTV
jgi:hypothetical protein